MPILSKTRHGDPIVDVRKNPFGNAQGIPTPQFQEFLDELAELLAALSFEVVTIGDEDFTVSRDKNQILICNNVSQITITMAEDPVDGVRTYIKRTNGLIKVTATKGIDGQPERSIINRYDCPLLVYTADLDEYSII